MADIYSRVKDIHVRQANGANKDDLIVPDEFIIKKSIR